jgi:hypothetical protein
MTKTFLTFLAISGLSLSSVSASIVFEGFNSDEGRFNLAPTFSGSTSGFETTSTADQVTAAGAIEGIGYEHLVLDRNVNATSRLRFLSGGGSAAGGSGSPANTVFTTSSGTDGWVGYYLRTSSPGTWTTQPWIEGASSAGGVEKTVITDGAWHLYEWNLDDFSGGINGWGAVPGIVGGTPTLANGNYTFDSVFLRGGNASTADNVFDFDFLAKSDSGSVAGLLPVPEPSTIALGLLGGAGVMASYFRRRAKK